MSKKGLLFRKACIDEQIFDFKQQVKISKKQQQKEQKPGKTIIGLTGSITDTRTKTTLLRQNPFFHIGTSDKLVHICNT